ncbi:MAG: hypothetical protein CL624_09275 [Arcobacter sp.]|nr:hypothetical protein [Arcobacter sp.]|tara:strand:+ start:13121 stop:13891 length:771 start_codon:yes stop_codon:yes gene_type:complete
MTEDIEKQLEEKIKEIREKDKMLFEQSKNSAMGEMISLIAHQWRQPLNELSIIVQQTKMKFDKDELTKNIMNDYNNKSLDLINKMSDTIDDFRYFFEPQTTKNYLNLKSCVDKVLSLIDGLFKRHSIDLIIDINSNITILGYENEFSQILLNFINNSKDAFESKKIEKPFIEIRAEELDNKIIKMTISDNAGGINEDIIQKIFNPYFTTKFTSQGTGLGLYMTKLIIENNMGGKVSVENFQDGTRFSIYFNAFNNK